MTETQTIFNNLSQELSKIILGQDDMIRQLLIALVANGHVILEGVPGTGKTMTVKVLAKLLQAEFRRIQLTPDVLPSDILGTNIFLQNTGDFALKKGPIFTQILLADEINRTPPKTQSALLEAMEEQQVTLDGKSIPLSELFWVIATQNSLEFEGTYPLPEAQLDRFLFKLMVNYPDKKAEKQMLLNSQASSIVKRLDLEKLQPIATVADCLQAKQEVKNIQVKDSIIDYILNLVEKTRKHPDLILGCSPRCAIAWLQASQANAWLNHRHDVIPDDVKFVGQPLLRHRLILRPESQLDGIVIDKVINSLLAQIPVPR
jgi:MoxR-like ATPase